MVRINGYHVLEILFRKPWTMTSPFRSCLPRTSIGAWTTIESASAMSKSSEGLMVSRDALIFCRCSRAVEWAPCIFVTNPLELTISTQSMLVQRKIKSGGQSLAAKHRKLCSNFECFFASRKTTSRAKQSRHLQLNTVCLSSKRIAQLCPPKNCILRHGFGDWQKGRASEVAGAEVQGA